MINPQLLLNKMMQSNQQLMNNPMFSNAYRMYQQNDINGLRTMAENMCKEKGISLQDLRTKLENMHI